ncbi:hypothetical protein F5Y19DRAFT_258822 [Xylariaceae sp. FL1651]|nr:hypothetical protein F5Y19DRAFT_258822 [Xylariaceae sp. FL1651]
MLPMIWALCLCLCLVNTKDLIYASWFHCSWHISGYEHQDRLQAVCTLSTRVRIRLLSVNLSSWPVLFIIPFFLPILFYLNVLRHPTTATIDTSTMIISTTTTLLEPINRD